MRVNHDKALDIALGNSRKTKTWKNKPVMWSEFLDRLSQVTKTSETLAEYRQMGRDRQSEIKDVGGFVGGYCNNGSRSDIRFRSVLCLDADFADDQLWPDWKLLYGNSAAVYSTHKHTTENPRLRLVVPLARNVTPDEYVAIGRRVADTLGIDKFDDTSYQPQRMMYWPSCSQDGEFFFAHTDGEFMDPDAILATYHNWQDVSSWPMSSRVAEVTKKSATKQSDPLEKGGLVGAFCRAYYPIQEAIAEYIPAYQPCDEPNRYTYTEGSTAAGVVIYEDKWSHSFHATDPASGHLCNAWDLVRLHKFGHLDDGCDPDMAVSSRPSYKAMSDLAVADKRVASQAVSDRMAQAEADFSEPVEDGDWTQKLKLTGKGAIEMTIGNVVVILKHDPKLAGLVAEDDMKHSIVLRSKPPWSGGRCPRVWSDSDDSGLREYLESTYGLSSKDKIIDAVNITAQKNAFHPVREYLDSCEWDGVPRVDTLLVDYLGADDNEYTRAVTRKTLVAAVARIYEPGCKFDQVLTIRGKQGIGKSTLIGKLGGKWFSDSFTTVQGKEAMEQIQGVWIVEIGELAGMRKAEVETVKHFISKREDLFRKAYGRRSGEYPRQCIFFATTNEQQFLRDTENRRFWVVDTPNKPKKDMWDDLPQETIKNIWGEAKAIYKAGESLYLSEKLLKMARDVQEIYEEENPKVGVVADYLDRLLPEGWDEMDTYARRSWLEGKADGMEPRRTVCTMEIWAEALGGNPDKFDRYVGKEIRDILTKIPGWRHQGNAKITAKPYGRQRYYAKEETT